MREAVDMGNTLFDTADEALDSMDMSQVFGGSNIVRR